MNHPLGVADYGLDVWFGGCYCLEERLEQLRAVGIGGIEWLKCTSREDAVAKAATFHRLGMDFASCHCGGDFELTLQCAAAFGREYVWLPVDCSRGVPMDTFLRRSGYAAAAAAAYGVKVALHNHLGSRIESQDELDRFMEAVPDALLLLDIAHLSAAGGDNVAAIRQYHDRLAAVHFKDVFLLDAAIGLERWTERLRFCELGGGNTALDCDSIAAELKRHGYNKWLLIEQDTHLRDPYADLKVSADRLKALF